MKIRIIEEKNSEKYKFQKMRCPVHLSNGQEAAAGGVCANLNSKDQIVSNHRCHAHYLAKGGNVYKMISEIHGSSDGCSGGRGGSMHLFDDENDNNNIFELIKACIYEIKHGDDVHPRIDIKELIQSLEMFSQSDETEKEKTVENENDAKEPEQEK